MTDVLSCQLVFGLHLVIIDLRWGKMLVVAAQCVFVTQCVDLHSFYEHVSPASAPWCSALLHPRLPSAASNVMRRRSAAGRVNNSKTAGGNWMGPRWMVMVHGPLVDGACLHVT